ncbi:MAG TPA: hypothetical protein VGG27_01680 [Magnetospirillaceae bacterium]
MGIYTIGPEADYDAALARGHSGDGMTPIKKTGPSTRSDGTPYYGGYAFQTAQEAFAYIDKAGKRDVWAVYEVDAVWPDHVWHGHPSDDFMRLNRDAVIVGKVEPSTEQTA